MKFKVFMFTLPLLLFIAQACGQTQKQQSTKSLGTMEEEFDQTHFEVHKSPDEWKKALSEDEYRVLREKGTEPAFSSKFKGIKEEGIYKCAACGNPLFTSNEKYDSGSGWPSFWDVLDSSNVKLYKDLSHGMNRIEVVCGKCGGHMGHVFNDGPKPTGMRYCINSVSLDFEKK